MDREALLERDFAERAQKAGLADAGFAANEERPAASGRGAKLEGVRQLCELVATADEGRAAGKLVGVTVADGPAGSELALRGVRLQAFAQSTNDRAREEHAVTLG